MKFKMVHNNINVFNLDRSLEFYDKALGLKEQRRIVPPDGRFIIVYLSDGQSEHNLELTWLRDWEKPYDLGDNEIHLAFTTDDYEGAYELHKKMRCICQEDNGHFYFIEDPDGYWLEILRQKK
mgnify:FL=1